MSSFFNSRIYLLLEFLIVCIGIPTFIIINTYAAFMFAFLWGVTLYGFLIYRRYYFTGWGDLWRWREVNWTNLKPILLRWMIACVAMMVFLWWYDPDRMFGLLSRRPEFALYLMVMYPVVSALPQEFVFCSFVFARYKRYFGDDKLMIAASALLFAYAHMLYINPVAPTISLIGGLIFAMTYSKTKSLALVTIEHGLYGNALFLIGLGYYFYSGAVQ